MRATRILISAVLFSVASYGIALAAEAMPTEIKMNNGMLTDAKGMTLYTWDNDQKGVSTCYDKCATAWPPLLVPAGTAVTGDFTLVDRKDSDQKIVAYKGMPLYTWFKDTKPGDTTGDGVGKTWHTAVESM